MHCNGHSINPGSTIVPDVFGGSARSDAIEPTGKMLFNHLAFKKLITNFCIINILIDVARKGRRDCIQGFGGKTRRKDTTWKTWG